MPFKESFVLINNIDESRIMDINIAFENISDVVDGTKSSIVFIPYLEPEALSSPTIRLLNYS